MQNKILANKIICRVPEIFFNSTTNVELAHLVVEGDKAAVIARYTAKSPAGDTQIFEVPEFSQCETAKLLPPASILTAPPLWPL